MTNHADGVAFTMEFFRPKATSLKLIRVGGRIDGGYLLPDDLGGVNHCFSPGVENRKDFEDDLLIRHKISSHMADFSSSVRKLRTPLVKGKQTFDKKWIAAETGSDSLSMVDWIASKALDPSEELLLQMDIEGSEYEILTNLPSPVLRRFRVIALELHDLHLVGSETVLSSKIIPMVEKLSEFFVSVHAHPNNCCPVHKLPEFGVTVPRILELTLIRKDRFVPPDSRRDERVFLPHPKDVLWNVPIRRPQHLGRDWIGGQRPLISKLRMLFDYCRYYLFGRWRRHLPMSLLVLGRNLRRRGRSVVGQARE